MKKVYQTVVDKHKGNCMQAVIASLFEKELEEVPNFIELGDTWLLDLLNYFKEQGYPNVGLVNNPKINKANFSFKEVAKYDGGVQGFFYATVPSQTFKGGTHAVVCNTNLKIVHDPNPNQLALNLKPKDIIQIICVQNFYIDKNGKIKEYDN